MVYALICGAGIIIAGAVISGIGAIFDNTISVGDIDRILKDTKDVSNKVETSISLCQTINKYKNTCIDLKRHKAILLNDINYLELLRKLIADGALVTESEEPELQNVLYHISSAKTYLSHLQ